MPLSEANSVTASARIFDYVRAKDAVARALAVETAVNVVYGPLPFAVMMATPDDLQDFAYGFSLTEGIISRAEDILSVEVAREELGLRLAIQLRPEKMQAHMARKRALSGRTGCGLCGIEDLASLPDAALKARGPIALRPESVGLSLQTFADNQPLNDRTRAVHAAAFFKPDGALVALREDVGRHNALDKLIGALLRQGQDPEDGFIVISSRCSFEMVEKAAAFGARAIVAISAPTSLALERAVRHEMTLIGVARSDYGLIFNDMTTNLRQGTERAQ